MTGKPHIPMRRGITLVELLVVVAILMILVTIIVPGLMPTMESRRIREAARGVNLVLNTARVRAMDSGRVTGVMLVRDASLPDACTVLRHVEWPPPYAGESLDARVRLQLADTTATNFVVRAQVVPQGSVVPDMIQGGSVRINNQGPSCVIGSINGGGNGVSDFTFFVPRNARSAVPWSATQLSEPLPFEIQRQPEPSATGEFKLPESICIDLAWSGTDFQPASFVKGTIDPSAPVIILFSPNGEVFIGFYDRIPFVATTPIYLLVGKRERIAAPPPPEDPIQYNWQDMNNLWVSLNPRTGVVTSGEVTDDPTIAGWSLAESRQVVRQAQNMGGR